MDQLPAIRTDTMRSSEIGPTKVRRGNAQSLTFIVDTKGKCPEEKRRNISQTRSHIMRAIRQKKRENNTQFELQTSTSTSSTLDIESQSSSSLNKLPAVSSQSSDSLDEEALANAVWAGNVRNNIFSVASSRISLMEREINVLTGRSPNSPYLDVLVDNIVHLICGKFWPGERWGIPSPLAKEWWPIFSNVPAVFHAMIYGAAIFYDDLRVSTNLSQSAPILRHKVLAYHELRKALDENKAGVASDELLLAMAYLGFDSNQNLGRLSEQEKPSPFKRLPPFRHVLWDRHFAYPKENIHITNSTKVIDMKGGLDGRSYMLAKTISLNDLQIAAVRLQPPHYPFWDIPEIVQCIENPLINVLPEGAVTTQATGFLPLLPLGMTNDVLNIVLDSSDVIIRFQHYARGTLKNPDLQSLFSQKNRQHHALLSLPPASTVELGLEQKARPIYDCVRLTALLFSSCVLFPLPASTGTVQRLVKMIKTSVEDLPLETVLDSAAPMVLWVLILGAISCDIMTEQDTKTWYNRRLEAILRLTGAKSWPQIKRMLVTFLWMDGACDEGALRVLEVLNIQGQ